MKKKTKKKYRTLSESFQLITCRMLLSVKYCHAREQGQKYEQPTENSVRRQEAKEKQQTK